MAESNMHLTNKVSSSSVVLNFPSNNHNRIESKFNIRVPKSPNLFPKDISNSSPIDTEGEQPKFLIVEKIERNERAACFNKCCINLDAVQLSICPARPRLESNSDNSIASKKARVMERVVYIKPSEITSPIQWLATDFRIYANIGIEKKSIEEAYNNGYFFNYTPFLKNSQGTIKRIQLNNGNSNAIRKIFILELTTGSKVILKTLRINGRSKSELIDMKKEHEISRDLNKESAEYFPGILSFGSQTIQFGHENFSSTELLLEYRGEPLHKKVRVVNGKITILDKTLFAWASKSAAAFEIMHNYGICHADIKPSNIVVNSDNPDDMKLSIVDFGSAIETTVEALDKCSIHNISLIKSATPDYEPPELKICREDFSLRKMDVYSWGISMCQLMLGWDREKLKEHLSRLSESFDEYERLQQEIRAAPLVEIEDENDKEVLRSAIATSVSYYPKDRYPFSKIADSFRNHVKVDYIPTFCDKCIFFTCFKI